MKEIERPLKSDDMKENVGVWYAEFISMDDATLFKVVTAANYMIIKPLVDLAYPSFIFSVSVIMYPLLAHAPKSHRTSRGRR